MPIWQIATQATPRCDRLLARIQGFLGSNSRGVMWDLYAGAITLGEIPTPLAFGKSTTTALH